MATALAEVARRLPIALTVVLGTRPEVVKLAPVVKLARRRPDAFRLSVVITGQHRQLAHQLMDEFGLEADVDLDLMRRNLGLSTMAAECLTAVSAVLENEPPDWVLVQGDTTSTLAGALAAFYNRIRVGHVEAGLRTGDPTSPFPEEMNRRLTTSLADLHFAPTEQARLNLLGHGVADGTIVVTGNTGIDSLFELRRHQLTAPLVLPALPTRRYVLVTVHRRENHGPALTRICDGLISLLDRHPDLCVLLPVHPSPQVREVLVSKLAPHARVVLCEPMDYGVFVQRLVDAALVLTDSGGVQEECAALGKPVLVLRDDTERHEAVDAGVAILVGTESELILAAATGLLGDSDAYQRIARPTDAFGDGAASARILDALQLGSSLTLRRVPPTAGLQNSTG